MMSICEKPASSVAALLDVTRGPTLRQDHPFLEAFPYRVRTKYFTADIQLYACADPSELSDAELAQFEALVVLFDANCDNFKEKAEQLQQLRVRCCNSEVNLALCELCDNEQIRKMFLERLSDFELIESGVNVDDQDECGLERMKEALRMHTWSNMVMHDREKLPGNPRLPEHLFIGGIVPLPPLPQEAASGSSKPEDENRDEVSVLPPTYPTQQQKEQPAQEQQRDSSQNVSVRGSADEAQLDPELAGMAFEELYAKFASLKGQAMSLTGDERKKFAEEVVSQFWRAMGQDEAELGGLDSDSD